MRLQTGWFHLTLKDLLLLLKFLLTNHMDTDGDTLVIITLQQVFMADMVMALLVDMVMVIVVVFMGTDLSIDLILRIHPMSQECHALNQKQQQKPQSKQSKRKQTDEPLDLIFIKVFIFIHFMDIQILRNTFSYKYSRFKVRNKIPEYLNLEYNHLREQHYGLHYWFFKSVFLYDSIICNFLTQKAFRLIIFSKLLKITNCYFLLFK